MPKEKQIEENEKNNKRTRAKNYKPFRQQGLFMFPILTFKVSKEKRKALQKTVEENLLELMYMHQAYHDALSRKLESQYALRGSKIKCSYGTKTALLDCARDHGVLMGSQPVLTCKDCTKSNIYNFGSCMCPETLYISKKVNGKPLPMTAAVHPNGEPAMKAWGNLYAHICVPLMGREWLQEETDLMIEDNNSAVQALVDNAVLTCQYGGMISIEEVPEGTQSYEKYVVLVKKLRVRKSPSAESEILEEYNPADRINVIMYSIKGRSEKTDAEGRLWVEVDLGENKTGWVVDEYIIPDKPVETTFPSIVKAEIIENGNTRVKELTPLKNWGAAGTGSYDNDDLMTSDGSYNIAVGPRVLRHKYPNDGKVWNDDFEAFSRTADVILRKDNKDITLRCYIKDFKAHTYNHYPENHLNGPSNIEVFIRDENGDMLENGIVQTGVCYPQATATHDAWVEETLTGNIIEFCANNTGGLTCSDYELVKVIAYLKEE